MKDHRTCDGRSPLFVYLAAFGPAHTHAGRSVHEFNSEKPGSRSPQEKCSAAVQAPCTWTISIGARPREPTPENEVPRE